MPQNNNAAAPRAVLTGVNFSSGETKAAGAGTRESRRGGCMHTENYFFVLHRDTTSRSFPSPHSLRAYFCMPTSLLLRAKFLILPSPLSRQHLTLSHYLSSTMLCSHVNIYIYITSCLCVQNFGRWCAKWSSGGGAALKPEISTRL